MKITEKSINGNIEWVEAGLEDPVLFCECSDCRKTITEDIDDINEGICDDCLEKKLGQNSG